jgi:hypothetical protein
MENTLAFIVDFYNLRFLLPQLEIFVVQSTFWEAISCSVTHEIPRLLWKLTEYGLDYNSIPLVNVVHDKLTIHPDFFI